MSAAIPNLPPAAPYPVQLTVDPSPGARNRLTVGLRFLWVIPIAIVLSAVSGGVWTWRPSGGSGVVVVAAAGGFLFWGPLLLIVFRQKYPQWWFDWNVALLRFSNRVAAYALLVRDEYPSTDEEQAVHLHVPYPDAKRNLNRWLPLVKWLLALPHYVVLAVLWFGGVVAVIIMWFSILFTGRPPAGMHRFVIDLIRWTDRVMAYALLLVTDVYPPFRLGA
jgi:hypothetical protein